ncbi:MAG: hypothetical protein LUD68_04515 [Rikenellaceae bacterium]|nr:hypothetical protein [Rikenellaceae bacterium]
MKTFLPVAAFHLLLVFGITPLAHAASAVGPLERLMDQFPLLGKFLAAENPWEMEPIELARLLFTRPAQLQQGNAEYPLLFTDRREELWPGEQVFELFSYETEYYCFDKANPVIKLHIGRPLLHSQQHGRVEEVARSRYTAPLFPFVPPERIPPLLNQLEEMVRRLENAGACRLESPHHRVSRYRLPHATVMTITDLTGSTNGSSCVEIMLAPEFPVEKFEGSQTLAFPEAEGFGRYAVGGRGGKVYVVTSLEDYLPHGRRGRPEGRYGQPGPHAKTLGEGNWIPYVDALDQEHPEAGRPLLPPFDPLPAEPVIPGTLREAIEASGPRYIVFAVSGDIELKSELVINDPYVTIAGQTAPGAGIQIKNFGLVINAHDVIVRYLRIRVGETKGPGELVRTLGEQTHALDVNAMNVVVDHCEMAYANDQIFNFYGHQNRLASTVQWSYIYGTPRQSTHEKGNHSMSMAANGWGFVSFHHNLIAHGERRNPRIDMLTFDFRNNVLYNYQNTGYGSDNDYLRLNYIGNTLKPGPDTRKRSGSAFAKKTLYGQWYGENNALPQVPDFVLFDTDERVVIPAPHAVAPVVTHSPEEVFRLVVERGGADKPLRDPITEFVSQSVLRGTGSIPDTPASWPQGGFAVYPPAEPEPGTGRNGIPDRWAADRGFDSTALSAVGREIDPRYDNLEVYINSL